jgi:hypothetical protein
MQFDRKTKHTRLTGRERFRMVIMLFGLMGCLALFYWLYLYGWRGTQVHKANKPKGPPPVKAPAPTVPFVERPEMLDGFVDFTEELEGDSFYYVLHRINSLSQEELEKLSKTPFQPHQYRKLTEKPQEFRGRFYRIRGRLLDYYDMVLGRLDNDAGLVRVYRGLIETPEAQGFNFVVIEKEREYDWGPWGDPVEICAMFVKVHAFVNQNNERVAFPLVVGRKLKKLRYPTLEESRPSAMLLGIVAVMLLLLILFALMSWRAHVADKKFADAYRKRHPVKLPSAIEQHGKRPEKTAASTGPPESPGPMEPSVVPDEHAAPEPAAAPEEKALPDKPTAAPEEAATPPETPESPGQREPSGVPPHAESREQGSIPGEGE